MRAPSLLIAVSLAAVAGACSRPAPQPDADLDRELDLALDRAAGPDQVVSKIELEGESATQPPAATAARYGTRSDSHTARDAAHERRLLGKPAPSPAAAVAPAREPAVATPASATDGTASPAEPQTAEPAPAEPTPDPDPADEPDHTGDGGGWFPQPTDVVIPGRGSPGGIGIGLPGGGVIIIRGGGSGTDPCDRRHPRGRGGIGGATGLPGLPGGIRRGGSGRGPRIGGIAGIFRR